MATVIWNLTSCRNISNSCLNNSFLKIFWLRTCKSYHHRQLHGIVPVSFKPQGQILVGFKHKFQSGRQLLKTKHVSLLFKTRNVMCCNRWNNIQEWKPYKLSNFCYYSDNVQTAKPSDHKDVFDRYCDSLIDEYERIMTDDANSKLKHEDVKRKQYLDSIIHVLNELKAKWKEYEELLEMKKEYQNSSEDAKDLVKMLNADMATCKEDIEELKFQIREMLIPEDKMDDNDILMEVHAAVGGIESMLFTSEIFDMYLQYIQYKGWTYDVLSEKKEEGGLRTATISVSGKGAYKVLKFEVGVHRVQRVPKTEKTGRIHTSTMTVSVMPQPKEIDIVIEKKDLKIDTFKSTGAGGQSVNTTDSAVRITHLPTNIRVESQEERSQIQNKSICMIKLRTKLYEKQIEKQKTTTQSQRKLQVGTANRSEKIRTYNYNQDRITDHRIHYTIKGVKDLLSGGETLDELITNLNEESKNEIFQEMLHEFEMNEKKNKTLLKEKAAKS